MRGLVVSPPRGLCASLAVGCTLLYLAAALVTPATAAVQVVSSSQSRLVFEVTADGARFEASPFLAGTERLEIPDWGTLSGEGEPRLPGRYFLVALPPRGGYSIRHTVVRSEPLGAHVLEPVPSPVSVRDGNDFVTTSETYSIDDAIYRRRGYTIRVADAGVGRVRHQRVLSLRLDPVAYDPATGETVVATVIRVEVTFETRTGRGRGEVLRPVPESAVWDRILSKMVVNPAQGRGWRAAPSRFEGSSRSARSARAIAGPVVKLRVRESRMHRVSAASAIAGGFPAGTATGDLHLFKRAYDDVGLAERIVDVGYKVAEDPAGTAGEFDGSDYVIFYGQALREDTLQDDPIQKFTDDNIYWLGASAGPRMSPKSVAPGFVSGDTTAASFPVTGHFEKDLWFREKTPPFERDFYYYHGEFLQSFSAPFSLDAVRGGSQFRLKARFLGANLQISTRGIDLKIINTRGTTVLNSVSVPTNSLVDYDSGLIPASALVEGINTFRIEPNPGNQVSSLDVLLNWFDVEYRSPYRAKGNVLDFHSAALAGDTSLVVTGLSRTDVMLFDITDPLAPLDCQLTAGHFTPAGGGQVLSFRETLSSQRRYIATPLDKIKEITGGDVIADVPSGLIGNPAEAGVDVVVVSHKNYLGRMQRWVDYRKAQGYRVLMADVEEIFDEFNGGVNHPRAIRRFVRHFFEKGNASFVVLVGDASEDNKGVHVGQSGVNFVPTESFTEFVGAGFNEDEVVTSDKWYVMLDHDFIKNQPPVSGANPLNFIPSLIVGRLPAGNDTEIRRMIDKILAFERPAAGDFWRRRMIRIADDAWSFQSLSITCNQPAEAGFERAEQAAAVTTENSIPNGFDVVRFFLSNRIQHPPVGTCVSPFVQQQDTRSNAVPALLDELARGATIVSFQAHMNRYAICHEFLFTSTVNLGETPDYLNPRGFNVGRPYLLFGMGCHLSDYAVHRERNRFANNGPNGDSLSELLLLLENRGAVSTYGSTGFEYLSTNEMYTDIIAKQFYENPRTDPDLASGRSQARWIFGEIMTDAELVNLSRRGSSGPGKGAVGMILRYHILGDPLLRIDAGPPRFEVTVDGNPVQSGSSLTTIGASDSVAVRAIITDEVAIEDITLDIAGVDASNQLTVTPLVDQGLDAARQYEVTFRTKIVPGEYDIILRAHQAVDTTGTNFLMTGEFVLKVDLGVVLKAGGRPLVSGDVVPPRADYVFELTSPVALDTSLIRVKIDGTAVPANVTQPARGDSTWLVAFSADLPQGPHTLSVFIDNASFDYQIVVSSRLGVLDVVAYPNPFSDRTQFVYTAEVAISGGTIDIFTTRGRRIAKLQIPPSARAVGQNAVAWDGRTFNGDEIANGVYLFVINVNQGGQQSTFRGKLVHVK
ncbi:MAG: C25 family cysteine peptidase [Candidatus Krumholzibacteriia bacterium]